MGAPGGQIRRPLSVHGTLCSENAIRCSLPHAPAMRQRAAINFGKDGAGDRIRTGDIDLGKVALYQLSYSR